MKRIVGLIVAMCSCSAWADIYTFEPESGNQGDFSDFHNWKIGDDDATELPDGDDRIVIPAGLKCNVVEDEINEITVWTVDSIEVAKEGSDIGELHIAGGVTLILENDDRNLECDPPISPSCPLYDAHLVNGRVILETDPVDGGAVLHFTDAALHRIGGEGTVEGESPLCIISIEEDVTIRNQLDVEEEGGFVGAMTIDGIPGSGGAANGSFENHGRVETGEEQTIAMSPTTVLDDIPGAFWKANACGAIVFYRASALSGDIVLGLCGNLSLYETVSTCGSLILTHPGGPVPPNCPFQITLHQESDSIAFLYASLGAVTSGPGCQNPADIIPEEPSCNDPFVILDSTSNCVCE